ncbi:hypothetical protein HO173_001575 [Letharia columbiana]|uniref:DUF6590 domain-containing protein n=1 Tax=Letharia columbiana TaxID=112416 RepID=A0A8H6L8S1_9LECA|nr:uncharacterized protein HO173_001575 [Letharia columbiana]KAF6239967.1 hypothetical protein HO173_001575 [Letharia columbiana]
MPRDGRPVWQPSNAPRKNQSPNAPSILPKRDPIPPTPTGVGNQAPRRFAGSVVWGRLQSPPHRPSNLGDGTSGKSGVVDELLEGDESWATQAADPKTTAKAGKDTQKDLVTAMAGLTVQPSPKTESTVPEWRRDKEKPLFPKPSASRAGSIFPRGEKQNFVPSCAAGRAGSVLTRNANHRSGQNDRPFRGAASVMSCTYQRTPDQPRLQQHLPNADNRHIGHGEWGPIYSENRFLIVVHNRPGDHYYAIPVYSHKGNGLAKKHHKEEYVSVADGRYPGHVVQQSAHRPITAVLKNGVDELLPMSAAYASYAVPRKYGLPVAHQGRLDDESTKRLVAMYLKWTDRKESDEL